MFPMKQANIPATPCRDDAIAEEDKESWFTKTCILEMFLCFHKSYGKNFTYRDFLMEVLLLYEKTCNAASETFGDFQSQNQYDKCKPQFDEHEQMAETEEENDDKTEAMVPSFLESSNCCTMETVLSQVDSHVPSSNSSSNSSSTSASSTSSSSRHTPVAMLPVKTESISSPAPPAPDKPTPAHPSLPPPLPLPHTGDLFHGPPLAPLGLCPSQTAAHLSGGPGLGTLCQQQQQQQQQPPPAAPGSGLHPLVLGRAFTCLLCGRGFSRKEHLLRHERIHTDDRPFPCPVCPRRFRRQDCQRKHVRAHHRHLITNPWTPPGAQVAGAQPAPAAAAAVPGHFA